MTYEAIGCGISVIVSPMGAGAVVLNEQEDIVVESNDYDDCADVFESLPDRKAEQLKMSASTRSLDFTYEKVGQPRREIILSRIKNNEH